MRHDPFRILFVAAALALPALSAAHEGERHDEGAEKEAKGPPKPAILDEKFLDKLTEHVKLTPEQQKKVKDILDKARPDLEKQQAEMKALHEKMAAAFKNIKGSMMKIKEGIRESLSADQKDDFDEMWARMRQRMHGGMGQRPGMGWQKGGRPHGPGPGMDEGPGQPPSGGKPPQGPAQGSDQDDD